jgi:uncharacterized membrane protein
VILTGGWTVSLGQWRLPVTRPEDVLLATLPILALRWWLRPPSVPAIKPRAGLAICVVAYALLFSFITVSRHYAFRTHALDLGQYLQIIWNIGQGRGAYSSLPEMHAWGDHFSPVFYLFAPILNLFPDPTLLLVAQSVILAVGALGVFAVARRRLGDERLAVAFAGLYLLNPSLHGVNLRDFHPAALAIALIPISVACIEAHRPGWFLLTVLLVLSTREDAAIAVIGLGLWVVLSHRRWVWGAGLAFLGLSWLFFTTGWLMPHFREGPYPHLHRFAHLGSSLGEIFLSFFTRPAEALAFMISGRRLIYLVALFAPLGFLPLLSPAGLVPAFPSLMVNLESRDPVLFHHRAQYTAFILPFLVLAAISGYQRFRRVWPQAANAIGLRVRPGMALALAVLVSLALTSRTVNDLGVNRWWLSDRQRAAYVVMEMIPPRATVSVPERFVPHLALRPKIFIFPTGLEQSDYVLIDLSTYPWRNLGGFQVRRQGSEVVLRWRQGEGVKEWQYEVAKEQDGYLLLKIRQGAPR